VFSSFRSRVRHSVSSFLFPQPYSVSPLRLGGPFHSVFCLLPVCPFFQKRGLSPFLPPSCLSLFFLVNYRYFPFFFLYSFLFSSFTKVLRHHGSTRYSHLISVRRDRPAL